MTRCFLLATAAGLVASSAFAADLPSKKAAPVEYVRVCSQYGAGFFYIPGSDTCLKIAGRVRAEYYYNEPLARTDNTTSTRARGYLTIDSYTATDWGPVRATSRVYVTKDSGSSATPTLDWSYIQFAGVTAGRVETSFFEFAPFGGVSFLGGGDNGRGSDYASINVLAYTYNAGNGFLATLALEDGTERRVGIGNAAIIPGYTVANGGYGGHVMPDVVGRLEYGASWGIAALTGAVHQTRYADGTYDTQYGYAIQGGVKVNLPMLAAGDALFLQAAYANGASSYTGWSSFTVGNASAPTYDVYATAAGGTDTARTWSVTGGIEHYWVPTVSTGLFASYGDFNGYATDDYRVFAIGANVKWSPVTNLLIGGEATYQRAVDTPAAALAPGGQKDIWGGRLRIERDF
ncbi:porin [Alsobacter sp. SYSU M60028]|uniref:Porin n=1 Tax=Alsobacter ponti TaxID=2962936 RepID=A0ABT1LBB4_9HYPH|nr:porin [Alsobacter ponti]MCP8938396.1 porin [Alsobacter ponti]